MYKIEENGLITGPKKGNCAGYIFNFTGHGAYDPTGKIQIGPLEVTQAQANQHNSLLAKAERDFMVKEGRGTFYITEKREPIKDHYGANRTFTYSESKVSQFTGEWKSPWCDVKHGYSYGFCRVQTRWIWFTGPDGKKWYGVNKGDMDCFTGRRMKERKE